MDEPPFLVRVWRNCCDFRKLKRSKYVVRTIWIAEQVSKLAIVGTVATYLYEAPQRQKSKEFQAWQVINTARGGDGGRKLAIRDLLEDGVLLYGIDLHNAILEQMDFRGVNLAAANLRQAILDRSQFSCRATHSFWPRGKPSCTTLSLADLSGAMISDCSFDGAYLRAATLDGTEPGLVWQDGLASEWVIKNTSFRGADLELKLLKKVRLEFDDFSNATIGGKWTDVIFSPFNSLKGVKVASGLTIEHVSFEHDDDYDNRGISARVDFSNAILNNVTVDGHSATEADFVEVRLCHTNINDRLSNRDCNTTYPDFTANLGPPAGLEGR